MGDKLVLITNRKSYMSFRLVPKSVILNDLERRNGVISANSGSFREHCVKVHVRYLISLWVLVCMKMIKKTSNGSELVDLISSNHTYSDTVANETVQALRTTWKGRRPKLHVNVHPKLVLTCRVCGACLLRLSHTAYYSWADKCTWYCSLYYFFLQAIPLFPHGVTIVC